MQQQSFLARFKSRQTSTSPTFDPVAPTRWADEFRASLHAQGDALAAQFGQALELAGGKFHTAQSPAEGARLVCEIARLRDARSVIAWNHPVLIGAYAELRRAGIHVTLSDANVAQDIRAATIAADVGLTACDLAIADTGTLLLVANEKQGRLTSLVPITHIALITSEQLVPTFADALKLLRLARLSGDGRLPSNISLHTGPSKTADIEQTLTKGVHGPKEVHVILCTA